MVEKQGSRSLKQITPRVIKKGANEYTCVAQLPLSSYAVQDPTQRMVTAIAGDVTAPEVVGPGRMELLNEADCRLMQWSASLSSRQFVV